MKHYCETCRNEYEVSEIIYLDDGRTLCESCMEEEINRDEALAFPF